MTSIKIRSVIWLVVAPSALLACSRAPSVEPKEGVAQASLHDAGAGGANGADKPSGKLAPGTAGSTSNCLAPPRLDSGVPSDIALTRQADANCFAWQEFLGLSWVAAPGQRGKPDSHVPPSKFGTPNDLRPVVWETYKASNEVFLADGANPGAWNSWPAGGSAKLLGDPQAALAPEPNLDLSDIGQASQGNPWLTSQSKLLTLYERRMNEDEYNYVVQNKLFDALLQPAFATSPGLNLPDGTPASASYGSLGAIETKAAWLELPNPADWPRFKISKALVSYPGQAPKAVVVGLVGLHIIHETRLGQQFIWATFEHRDNAPDAAQVQSHTLKAAYTYYNPNCDPQTDYYQCAVNTPPQPPAQGPTHYDAPNQVVRQTPIPARPNDDVAGLNDYVWAQVIQPQSPKSVFQNYELVNVLWSNQNTPIPAAARVPLIAAQLSPGPSQELVANTTLETYVQALTCLSCHASAAIASESQASLTKIYDPATAGSNATASHALAADYSFLLRQAQPSHGKTGRTGKERASGKAAP